MTLRIIVVWILKHGNLVDVQTTCQHILYIIYILHYIIYAASVTLMMDVGACLLGCTALHDVKFFFLFRCMISISRNRHH